MSAQFEIPCIAGIILVGGKSTRMGRDKATLPFGPELMLERVVRILGEVVSPVVVVAAADQQLPPLPLGQGRGEGTSSGSEREMDAGLRMSPHPAACGSHPLPEGEGFARAADILIARDERQSRGPLEGLHAGLSKLAAERPEVTAVFATSCDVPLLAPAFVRTMLSRLGDFDIAVPVEDGFPHPLAAVYRLTVLPHVAALLAADQLRPAFLFDRVATNRVDVAELRTADPQLLSLKNCNRPEDYEEALRTAGYSSSP